MMMAALSAGGLTLVTDDQRPADQHNQRGYFEHQAVKTLEQDNSWLTEHRGQPVKIIYRLLYHLPPEIPAKIVFMRRDVREVAASQSVMLGEPLDPSWPRVLVRELMKVDRWLAKRDHFEVLDVPHREVITEPELAFGRVNQFLGGGLDVPAMVGTVHPDLYRQRS